MNWPKDCLAIWWAEKLEINLFDYLKVCVGFFNVENVNFTVELDSKDLPIHIFKFFYEEIKFAI